MHVTVKKQEIKDKVFYLEKIAGKNATLPILGSILFTAKGKQLVLRSTNLDVGVEVVLPARVEKEGGAAVPAHIISQLIAGMYTDGDVVFKKDKENIAITSQDIHTVVKCFPVEDFPTLPTARDGEQFSISAEKLVSGIRAVSYSASPSDVKPELSSVYMYPKGKALIFVSTDSFRLAEKSVYTEAPLKEFDGVIIPYRNALEIARVFEGVSGDVDIHITKTQIIIKTPSIYFTSRVVDGVFPDYTQIIPKEKKTTALALKQDVIQALKINTVFLDKLHKLHITVDPSKKQFTLHAVNSDIGESVTHIDSTLEGEAIDVYVNYRYVMDSFQSIPQDSVVFEFLAENKPIVIKGVSDNTFTYLVMPINK